MDINTHFLINQELCGAPTDIADGFARVDTSEGKKQIVDVSVQRNGEAVFQGVFTCFVLDKHVLHDRLDR